MADTKLSALTELAATPADNDELYIRDESEAASAESKRITVVNLLAGAGGGGGALLTVTQFQANAATGTMGSPQGINDNNTNSNATGDDIGEYAQVLFDAALWVTQFRQYGTTDINGDGFWKLQVLNPATLAWEDWITGISTRALSSWSNWTSNGAVLAAGIRLVATTIDTFTFGSRINELEVKY